MNDTNIVDKKELIKNVFSGKQTDDRQMFIKEFDKVFNSKKVINVNLNSKLEVDFDTYSLKCKLFEIN